MLARKAANITSIRRIAAAQATARRQLTQQQQSAAAQQVQHIHIYAFSHPLTRIHSLTHSLTHSLSER